jgi:phospholipid transport system transporter-binding protein
MDDANTTVTGLLQPDGLFAGPLTRVQAVAVMAQAQDWLARAAQTGTAAVRVNLGALTQVDTSALAVLLGLKRMAPRLNCQLTYAGAPKSLLALARLSSVDQLLDLA